MRLKAGALLAQTGVLAGRVQLAGLSYLALGCALAGAATVTLLTTPAIRETIGSGIRSVVETLPPSAPAVGPNVNIEAPQLPAIGPAPGVGPAVGLVPRTTVNLAGLPHVAASTSPVQRQDEAPPAGVMPPSPPLPSDGPGRSSAPAQRQNGAPAAAVALPSPALPVAPPALAAPKLALIESTAPGPQAAAQSSAASAAHGGSSAKLAGPEASSAKPSTTSGSQSPVRASVRTGHPVSTAKIQDRQAKK